MADDDEMVPPSAIQRWDKDPAYVDALEKGAKDLLKSPPDVDAILVGIRFLHNFAKTHEGERAVQRALDEGLVELVPGEAEDNDVYAVPRLLWRDTFYDDLCHGKGVDVSIGIAFARHMLWGPPELLTKPRGKLGPGWKRAIETALRRFEAEPNQKRQHLAEAIRVAAEELALRASRESSGGETMVAVSSEAIYELVRLRIPDVTLDEVGTTFRETFAYMGGLKH